MADKKPINELLKLLSDAKKTHRLYEGSVWRHHSNKQFTVSGLSIDCKTQGVRVHYGLFELESYTTVPMTRELEGFVANCVHVRKTELYLTKEEEEQIRDKWKNT